MIDLDAIPLVQPQWRCLTPQANVVGESPFWHDTEKTLYWVDIPAKCICRLKFVTMDEPYDVQYWPMQAPLDLEPCCIAPLQGGGLVIALRDGVYIARQWQGQLQKITGDLKFDTSIMRFNDGKCDHLGRFWLGTMYEPRTQALGQLFCIDARAASTHGVRVSIKNEAGYATVANGLAFSPDQTSVYWGDTTSHRVRKWVLQESPQSPTSEASLNHEVLFAQFTTKPMDWNITKHLEQLIKRNNQINKKELNQSPHAVPQTYEGRPDGAMVDALGNYYVAMIEGAQLVQFSPQGVPLLRIATPVVCPTMPCLGGIDGQTLFITSARHGRSSEELAQYPQSGHVFCTPWDTLGVKTHAFVMA